MIEERKELKTRVGVIEFGPDDVLSFPDGLLGFPDQRRFVLVQHKENSPFRWLLSIDDTDLAFLVVDPAEYVTDYAPPMPKRASDALRLDHTTPMLVYTIVTIPSGHPEDMTLNLAGPVVVNCEAGLGRQIVLDDEAYPVRHRAFAHSGEGKAA